MYTIKDVRSRLLFACLLWVALAPLASAHLMPAQRGTLNIVDGGVFMVLSLPISAFSGMGLDENSDGSVSLQEFDKYRGGIIETVRKNVTIMDHQGIALLDGIMLSPVMPHDDSVTSISQLTVLGRFNVSNTLGTMRFQVGIYGRAATEQSLEIIAMRKRDKQKTVFELTPDAPLASINFPTSF